MLTWGKPDSGGDSSQVREQLVGVQQIQATCEAFAAVLETGSIVTWGRPDFGGDIGRISRRIQTELDWL